MNTAADIRRVAFMGERGAFGEQAALALFGESVALVSRPNFDSLFAAIDEEAADAILAPIENSSVGFIRRTRDLLLDSGFVITAEVVIPITHHLIGCRGATIDSIRTVESHPVALAQCRKFFDANERIERVAADDTAGSVRRIVEGGDRTRAAIGSRRAAEIYGGVILRENLEDHADNHTRFVLLARV